MDDCYVGLFLVTENAREVPASPRSKFDYGMSEQFKCCHGDNEVTHVKMFKALSLSKMLFEDVISKRKVRTCGH